jgi:hypothetical protein
VFSSPIRRRDYIYDVHFSQTDRRGIISNCKRIMKRAGDHRVRLRHWAGHAAVRSRPAWRPAWARCLACEFIRGLVPRPQTISGHRKSLAPAPECTSPCTNQAPFRAACSAGTSRSGMPRGLALKGPERRSPGRAKRTPGITIQKTNRAPAGAPECSSG